ncbi:unnamed protein product, partial [Didymodactylos carnosus]
QVPVVIILLFFIGASITLKCYMGTDKQCLIVDSTSDHEDADLCEGNANKRCTCGRFKLKCTADDAGCTDEERYKKTEKWAYTLGTKDECQEMVRNGKSNGLKQITCCDKNLSYLYLAVLWTVIEKADRGR